MLKLNQKAPNFKLPSTNNSVFELSKNKGKNIILYFYPKDNTKGCTLEAADFSGLYTTIKNNNCIILGISKDSIESHLKFIKKYNIMFDLLSDLDGKIIEKYNAWGLKKFLGKEYMGIIRTTIIINSDGKVHKIWSNVRVKNHAEEVIAELKKINNHNDSKVEEY
ncbi:peroxiredoxin [Alphaproteobacteria bacterium]|nr:peroxiredoxin [Alphaproteobacteria bacterium]